MDEQNQCDGCRRGLPVENGIHHGPTAWDIMRCTADRYRRAGMSNLPPLPMPQKMEYSVLSGVDVALFTERQLRAFAEEAVRLERERVANQQKANDEAAELFHQVLCTGEGCDECARVAAAIRARSQEG